MAEFIYFFLGSNPSRCSTREMFRSQSIAGLSDNEPRSGTPVLISYVRGLAVMSRNGRGEQSELSLSGQIAPKPVRWKFPADEDVVSAAQAIRLVPREHRTPRRFVDPHGTTRLLAEGVARSWFVPCNHFDARKSCGSGLDASQDFDCDCHRRRHTFILKDEHALRSAELQLFVHQQRVRGCACVSPAVSWRPARLFAAASSYVKCIFASLNILAIERGEKTHGKVSPTA